MESPAGAPARTAATTDVIVVASTTSGVWGFERIGRERGIAVQKPTLFQLFKMDRPLARAREFHDVPPSECPLPGEMRANATVGEADVKEFLQCFHVPHKIPVFRASEPDGRIE